MCVTVRTLCLLVSSVSVILSVARAVIHDMLHLMVHQGCDPLQNHSAVSQNGHDVGVWILDTWENRRASVVHRKGVSTSGDSSSSRTSQLLTHASETWLTMWREEQRHTC